MMGSVGLFIVRWVLFSQWGLWVLFSLLCWSCCFHSGSCFHCYVGLVFTMGLVFTVMLVLFSQWVLFSLLCGACCFHSGSCFHSESCFHCYVGLVVFTIGSLGLVITVCSIGLHLMCANCILLALSTYF